jgi:hypothetical protein
VDLSLSFDCDLKLLAQFAGQSPECFPQSPQGLFHDNAPFEQGIEVGFTAGHNGLGLLVLLRRLVKGLRDRVEHTRCTPLGGMRLVYGRDRHRQGLPGRLQRVRTTGCLAGGGHTT